MPDKAEYIESPPSAVPPPSGATPSPTRRQVPGWAWIMASVALVPSDTPIATELPTETPMPTATATPTLTESRSGAGGNRSIVSRTGRTVLTGMSSPAPRESA